MDKMITWKPLPKEEKVKTQYDELFGDNSPMNDPIISTPYDVLMPKSYEKLADTILNFEVRSDDIWIITYPKCGTTWTQEIVWNIMNDMDKELGQLPLFARSPFLEFQSLKPENNEGLFPQPQDEKRGEMMRKIHEDSIAVANDLKSPRVIKSHLPLELLPRNLLDTAKVIYVCRNPKDTCISMFNHQCVMLNKMTQFKGDFDRFTELFMDGKVTYGNYFNHLKSGWKRRNHPNLKFVWYEDMRKDSHKEIAAMAEFVNHPLTEEKLNELVEHVKFNNMKERASKLMGREGQDASQFFRKGQVGDWKNHFQGDKLQKWDSWIAKNLEGTDIEMNFE